MECTNLSPRDEIQALRKELATEKERSVAAEQHITARLNTLYDNDTRALKVNLFQAQNEIRALEAVISKAQDASLEAIEERIKGEEFMINIYERQAEVIRKAAEITKRHRDVLQEEMREHKTAVQGVEVGSMDDEFYSACSGTMEGQN